MQTVRRTIAIAILPLVAAVACSTQTPITASSPPGKTAGASQILAAAISATDRPASYHMVDTISTRTARGPLLVLVSSDVERPDRIQTTMKIERTTVDSITVRGNTWIRDTKTNRWVSKSAPTGTTGTISDPFAAIRGLTGVLLIGTEIVGGVATYHLRGTEPSTALVKAFPAAGGAPATGRATVDVWIAKTNDLILRLRASTGVAGGLVLDASFSRFGALFNIRPPK